MVSNGTRSEVSGTAGQGLVMTLRCPLGEHEYKQTVDVLSCQSPECGCLEPGKASRNTQNNVQWDLNGQRLEGIAAEGGRPPPVQNVTSLGISVSEKEVSRFSWQKNCYGSKIKSPFRKKCKPLQEMRNLNLCALA